MGFFGKLVDIWDKYAINLYLDGITFTKKNDHFTWDGIVVQGKTYVKEVYMYISQSHQKEGERWWFQKVWKWNFPLKLKIFWLVCLEEQYINLGKIMQERFCRTYQMCHVQG